MKGTTNISSKIVYGGVTLDLDSPETVLYGYADF